VRFLKQDVSPNMATVRKWFIIVALAYVAFKFASWLAPYLSSKVLLFVGVAAVAGALVASWKPSARAAGGGLRYLIFLSYFVAVVFPLTWVFYTSAKTTQQIYQNPFGLPRVITHPSRESAAPLLENYSKAWTKSQFSDFAY